MNRGHIVVTQLYTRERWVGAHLCWTVTTALAARCMTGVPRLHLQRPVVRAPVGHQARQAGRRRVRGAPRVDHCRVGQLHRAGKLPCALVCPRVPPCAPICPLLLSCDSHVSDVSCMFHA